MDSLNKIKELNKKISELKLLLEDFINLHSAKKNKILNLETEIKDIKLKMSNFLLEKPSCRSKLQYFSHPPHFHQLNWVLYLHTVFSLL